MSEQQFAAKVDYEGGVFGALEYGLTASDCVPGPLHDAWAELEKGYAHVCAPLQKVEEALEAVE